MRFWQKLAIGFGALAVLKGFDNSLEITECELFFENLPDGLDGFRIAHISDLHSEAPQEIFSEIKSLSPDMIAVTGDMIHDDERSFNGVLRLFKDLSKVAPIYMVSGNHDLWNTRFDEFLQGARSENVHFIDDTLTEISYGGAKFALFGIRDPFGKATDIINKSLEKSFSLLPEYDGFKVLLFHRANLFPRLLEKGFDLILSGHMHGGQFRIKGLGGLMPPKSSLIDSREIIFPKYTEGVYTGGGTTMLVNRGIGNPMIIPRLYNRPELGIVTLKKAE